MLPVVETLRTRNAKVTVCVTAQHRGMLDQVMEFFGVTPDIDLDLMQPGQTLNTLFSRIVQSIDKVTSEESYDLALVHGDTTTASAAAIACFHKQIPVGHVEAGLRSGDFFAPFPEEMNRVVIDSLAKHLFAPTEASAQALYKEGHKAEDVVITGNTVIDALLMAHERLKEDAELRERIDASLPAIPTKRKMILVTGHRRENFGGGFERLCHALKSIADRGDVQIVYPVHLNPNVLGPVQETLGHHDAISLIEPTDYPSFIRLMQKSHLVITDSGGVQEEAPSFGKPVLVTREVTERWEAVDAGVVKLVGTDDKKLVSEVNELLDNEEAYNAMSSAINPYGDGLASARICDWLGIK